MDPFYHSTIVYYRREGDRVQARKVRREWISLGESGRHFVITRTTSVEVDRIAREVLDTYPTHSQRSTVKIPTRAELIASGTVTPGGEKVTRSWPHGILYLNR